jgi:hypothetical protein
MQRIDEDHLRKLALEAVEEAAAGSHLAPVHRTRGLALALAWLRHRGADTVLPLWPFKSFWEGLGSERPHDRWSTVNEAGTPSTWLSGPVTAIGKLPYAVPFAT